MYPSDESTENEWDPSSYDGEHSFVYEYGEDLIDLLEPQPGERILDLGCGTGHLTDRIAGSGADAIGVDTAAEMIEIARSTYPDCRFVRGDARRLPFDRSFDAVFSNAALHWVKEQDAALRSVAHALRSNGRFVAELGGVGNVGSIVDAVETELQRRGYEAENPWYFPTPGEYATKLEEHGFEVRYLTLFDRPTELDDGANGLRAWLEMFGDSWLSPLLTDERDAVIERVEDRLRDERFVDGTWIADYRRLRVIAVLDSA